jgi:multidrug transporter EmrE-like cation transporter
MDRTILFLLILIILSETSAQFFLQKHADSPAQIQNLVLGMSLYAIIGYLYFKLLRSGKQSLTLANTLWNIGSTILIAFVGYFFFKQVLNRTQFLGIILVLVGTILLSLK